MVEGKMTWGLLKFRKPDGSPMPDKEADELLRRALEGLLGQRKQMSKFKVGDRVRVYGGTNPDEGEFFDGTVRQIEGRWLVVKDDRNGEVVSSFHVKQCRKLVRKERRRVWIRESIIPIRGDLLDNPPAEHSEQFFIEFVEVRKRK
jgi:hypothetical protein